MRILLAIPLLLFGACYVSKDSANNSVSLTVNEEQAANAASNAGDTIQNIAKDVGNEASNLGDKVQNTSVKVDTNVKTGNAAENKTK
jgi:hypothetical protein